MCNVLEILNIDNKLDLEVLDTRSLDDTIKDAEHSLRGKNNY